MNKLEFLYRVSFLSLAGMVIVLVVINILNVDGSNLLIQMFGGILSLTFFFPALYIWVTGFARFKSTIGFYSGKWLAYIAFNLLAGLYLHHVYKKQS